MELNTDGARNALGAFLRKATDPSTYSDYYNERRNALSDMMTGVSDLVTDSNGARNALAAAIRNAPKFDVPDTPEAAMPFWNPGGLLGKIVYHGSPHRFTAFDASKIGTGEGAQAYGHGLYLADKPETAGEYIMAGRNMGYSNFDSPAQMADRAFGFARGNKEEALKNLGDAIASTGGDQKRRNLQLAQQIIEAGNQKASLYKADLPDEWLPRMLDWDKPLAQQPQVMQRVRDSGYLDKMRQSGGFTNSDVESGLMEGRHLLSASRSGRVDESAALRASGIPGIRYLDGGSRGSGQGTSNYVVFPGMEDLVKILEVNGMPVK